MAAPESEPALCVVLHDVAPQTWDAYQPFVAFAERLGVPLTLLVVPDFHHAGDLRRHPRFVSAMNARLARGDEIALHGYFHADELPLRGDPVDFFMRRVYTREAEFYRLDTAAAGERLQRGLELFAGLGWHASGFVAPAWLPGPGTRAALRACRCVTPVPRRRWSICDRTGRTRHPDWCGVPAAGGGGPCRSG